MDLNIAAYLFIFKYILLQRRVALKAPFTIEEVWVAIQAMSNGKCPGPDGFPLKFLERFWPKIHPILMPPINNIWK